MQLGSTQTLRTEARGLTAKQSEDVPTSPSASCMPVWITEAGKDSVAEARACLLCAVPAEECQPGRGTPH